MTFRYSMAASTSAYFLGNDTGLNSAAETAAEARSASGGMNGRIVVYIFRLA